MEPFVKNTGLTKKQKEEQFMKKTLFIAFSLILSLAVLPLSAEKGKGHGEGKRGHGMHDSSKHFNMMQEKLGLTNDQVAKMEKIKKDYMGKFQQNKGDADKMKELKGQCRQEMESVLTPEQKAKWAEMRQNFKKGDGKKGDKKKGGQNKK